MSQKMKTMLFVLVAGVAMVSLLTGLLLMSVPDGSLLNLSVDQLSKSPFRDFRIPGLIMFATVGVTNLVAVFMSMVGHLRRYQWSLGGGILLMAWAVFQDVMTKGYFFIDMFFVAIGIMIVLMSVKMSGKTLI